MEAFLPRPDGIKLVCWPKAGGTNPDAVRHLLKIGVDVNFADGLHMKLYWAEGEGVVITSANLSTHALGVGNLAKFGVLLPVDSVDIDRVLSSIKPRRVTKRELIALDKAHFRYTKHVEHENIKPSRFQEWYSQDYRRAWKLGWWESYGSPSRAAKQYTREQYNKASPTDFLDCAYCQYVDDEWALSFCLVGSGVSKLKWLAIDRVVPSDAEESDYPWQAIQVWPPKALLDAINKSL